MGRNLTRWPWQWFIPKDDKRWQKEELCVAKFLTGVARGVYGVDGLRWKYWMAGGGGADGTDDQLILKIEREQA